MDDERPSDQARTGNVPRGARSARRTVGLVCAIIYTVLAFGYLVIAFTDKSDAVFHFVLAGIFVLIAAIWWVGWRLRLPLIVGGRRERTPNDQPRP